MLFVVRWALRLFLKDVVLDYGPQIVATLVLAVVMLVSTSTWALAVMAQPGGIYWLAAHAPPEIQAKHPLVPIRTTGGAAVVTAPDSSVPIVDVGTIGGNVTDAQRYGLAREAGWSALDAITAVAISIAENGSGNPSLMSAANFDGSRDLGLWQVNSGWWPRFGGQAALVVPINNARAGLVIYGLQGWCAWSTYEASCGKGHNSAYRAFLDRARRATGES